MIIKQLGAAILVSIFSLCAFAQNTSIDSDSSATKQVKIPARDAVEDAVKAAELAIEESIAEEKASLLRKERQKSVLNFTDDDTLALYGESFQGLSLLDDEVKDKRVFITGENHTFTESNARLWLKMIKYLYANAGVRNIMFEYGYSYGFLVNEYLRTGDTTLFNSFNQFAYTEYSQAIKELKVFNDGLPEGEKLYFTAIDIERGVYPIPKILAYLLPKTGEPSDSISLHVQSIQSLTSYNDFKLDEEDENETIFNYTPGFQFKTNATLDLVHDNFLKFESDYKAYLGDNFEEFKKIIVTYYLARKQWLAYENGGAIQEYIYRENFMHKRFLEEQALHKGNWFGQFGRCHTTQTKQNSNSCDWFEFNSLADRIKNTPGGEFSDKVMSIAVIYNKDRYTSFERKKVEKEFDKYFDDVDDNRIVLLDIRKDSILQNAFGDDFNFIFLNRFKRKDRNEEAEYIYDDMEDDVAIKMVFGLSQWNYKTAGLNNAFSDPTLALNLLDIPEQLNHIDFTILTTIDAIKTGTSIGFVPSMRIAEVSNITYKLSSFYVKDVVYIDLLNGEDWLDFMPGLGIGYARFKMKLEEDNAQNNGVGDGWIGESRTYSYVNAALLGDIRIALDLNIKNFTIGVLTGYNVDFSKKQWKSGNGILNNSFNTSYSGLFSNVHLGFNF
jgi:hypothetical protein